MNQLNLREILTFVRFSNLIIIVFCMWLIRLRMIQPFLELNGQSLSMSPFNFHLYVIDILLVTVMGYWINDWRDQNVDAINAPNRLLVRHQLSKQRFKVMLVTLLISATALTIYLAVNTNNIQNIWIFPVTVGLLFAYSKTFNRKGLVGNLMVSTLIASLPLMAFLSEPYLFINDKIQSDYLWACFTQFSLLIFLSTLAREITKDMADMRGDVVAFSRSLPLTIGIQKTKYIVAVALSLIAAVEIYFLQTQSITAASAMNILILIAIGILLWYLFRVHLNLSYFSLGLKILMILGLFQMYFVY